MTTERSKDDIERAERDWDHLAESQGHRCSVCSTRIAYGDREVFFRTKMCGHCAHQSNKAD
jgi:hypothetical protein